LTGVEKLSGARLAVLQSLTAAYQFISLGEAPDKTATLRFLDIEDSKKRAGPSWQFSYPISSVSENDLMGCLENSLSHARSRWLEQGRPFQTGIRASGRIPQALLDVQAAVSAKAADASVFSGMLSNRIQDLRILAQYKLIKYSALLDSAISVLENSAVPFSAPPNYTNSTVLTQNCFSASRPRVFDVGGGAALEF